MNKPDLKNVNWNKLGIALLCDLIGSFVLGISIDVYAVNANFAPGGVTGLAVLTNYLFGSPIGLVTVLINIPIIVLTFKRLGPKFFVDSIKTVLIGAVFIDYICCHLPVYEGSRLVASILSGIFAGIGYSLIFNANSSTGGTDFIIVAIRQVKPKLSFGLLAFVIDSSVVVLSMFVFREVWSFVYGMVYTAVTSIALDATTAVLKRLFPDWIKAQEADR